MKRDSKVMTAALVLLATIAVAAQDSQQGTGVGGVDRTNVSSGNGESIVQPRPAPVVSPNVGVVLVVTWP